jgi:cysteine desulfurase
VQTIYLDNNATTAIAPEVRESMLPFLSERYGNPSSMHRFGGAIRKHVDAAREQVAALLNASPAEIFFTSCGTESDNTALQGFATRHGSRTRLITSTVEHPAVGNCCRFLSEHHGVELREIGVDGEGLLDMEALKHSPIDAQTLATFMWANNETGVLFPIDDIVATVKARGGLVHTDAVQAVGKIPIDIQKTQVDMLSLSGHKLHAPKGVGALYLRKGVKIPPLLHGGHQESGLRGGTENVAFIVGLGTACSLAADRVEEERTRVRSLRDRLEANLLKRCTAAKRNGHPELRLPNTANISFEFIEGEAVLLLLDEKGIAASSGSACTSGAMGIPYTFAHSSTRFSLSRFTTDAEIDEVISVMPGIVDRLRAISPFVK